MTADGDSSFERELDASGSSVVGDATVGFNATQAVGEPPSQHAPDSPEREPEPALDVGVTVVLPSSAPELNAAAADALLRLVWRAWRARESASNNDSDDRETGKGDP